MGSAASTRVSRSSFLHHSATWTSRRKEIRYACSKDSFGDEEQQQQLSSHGGSSSGSSGRPRVEPWTEAANDSIAAAHAEGLPAGHAKYYLFGGRRFTDYDEFLRAVARDGGREHPTASELSGPAKEEFAERVRKLFREYAAGSGEIASKDFSGLAASVAAELGIDPDKFRNLGGAFDRYDVNGDGLIDQQECVMLAESMLRYYVHAMRPRRTDRATMMELEYRELDEHYRVGEKVGRGGQGSVFLARELSTQLDRVVKIFDKGNANAPVDEIKEEFRLLRTLDHPRIQRLYDVFEDRINVYLISEPYYGGHLGRLIENAWAEGVFVSIGYLARALHQVMQGVAYLHSNYITHCDLKEANVMVTSDDNLREPSLVVIDFGLAHFFAQRGQGGGTPGYMPPEVWTRGMWTPKGDVHALGVVAYHLYSNGSRCFEGWGDDAVRQSTLNTTPNLDAILSSWPRCGDLLPLLESMLQKDPRKRPTVKQCMEHSFFVKRLRSKFDDEDEEIVPEEVVASLRGLTERTHLQRAAHRDMASGQNLMGLRQLNEAFDAMDTDHDGVLTEAEVCAALRHQGVDAEEIGKIVSRLVGKDGQVAYTSFMGELLTEKSIDEGRLLWQAFQELDTQGLGYLEKESVALVLQRPALAQVLGTRTCDEIMTLMDADSDGRVVFEEFRRALNTGSAKPGESFSHSTVT